MANTTRQNILNSIKTTLEAIVDGDSVARFKNVTLGRIPSISLDTTPLPCIIVYTEREERIQEGEEAVIGKESWDWTVILEVWAYDKDSEDVLNWIHTAMYANYKFDNYAIYSERMGVDFLTIDAENRLDAMLIPYRIVYRHTLGAM